MESIHHPMVWATCVAYAHSTALTDRVWGDEHRKTFVVLLYFKGSAQPHLVECQGRNDFMMTRGKTPSFTIATAETVLQVECRIR